MKFSLWGVVVSMIFVKVTLQLYHEASTSSVIRKSQFVDNISALAKSKSARPYIQCMRDSCLRPTCRDEFSARLNLITKWSGVEIGGYISITKHKLVFDRRARSIIDVTSVGEK